MFLKKFSKKVIKTGIALLLVLCTVLSTCIISTNNEKGVNNAEAAGATWTNGTMMQYFEWNLPSDGSLWTKVANNAQSLSNTGFTALWLPPAYKGQNVYDVGYGPYDLYDLGEFNQKGTVRTKYGTKDQYLNAINKLHQYGMQAYADIVLNHKAAADYTQLVSAQQVASWDRNYATSDYYDIEAWTGFDFAGRNNKYSQFKWNWTCFDGVDYDNRWGTNAIFKFNGHNWDWQVETEYGNYDYLMFADVDFDKSWVNDELKYWGVWYTNFANLDGFRLDAVKHIKYSFFKDWLNHVRYNTGKEMFSVGEFWSYDINKLTDYINQTGGTTSLFDVPLHFHFYDASTQGGNYDMRNLYNGTLASVNPMKAVTFVDNHDSQPGQSLQSPIMGWFKPLAYTAILTRECAYPCVFYGDYYGTTDGQIYSYKSDIDTLMYARKYFAYGREHTYFDHHDIVGWTREGDNEHANSGLAALITDGPGGSKYMYVGQQHAGEVWYDLTGHVSGTVTINNDGCATFSVNGGSNSVWVKR